LEFANLILGALGLAGRAKTGVIGVIGAFKGCGVVGEGEVYPGGMLS
jgi:hypothetical protein